MRSASAFGGFGFCLISRSTSGLKIALPQFSQSFPTTSGATVLSVPQCRQWSTAIFPVLAQRRFHRGCRPAILHPDEEYPTKARWLSWLGSRKITIMTRVHIKRMASPDQLALCGMRARESFKLIHEVSKLTPLERACVCKVCLKAALGIEGQSSSATSGS